jgi:hypothetical protein
MKKNDLPPIFIANMEHKYFSSKWRNEVKVVRLQCNNPNDTNLDFWETYYGYEDSFYLNGFINPYETFPCYKIFLPILGCRKYKPSRFKVLDTLILKRSDFNEDSLKDLSLTLSKNKNKEQYCGPSKEVHTGALYGSCPTRVPNTNK